MALARLALKNLKQRIVPPASASALMESRVFGATQRGFSSEKKGKSDEVAVSEGNKRSRLFPRRQRRRWLSRNPDSHFHFPPALNEFLPSDLGNALMQATENINRLFENMNVTPWSLSGRVKEKEDHYKLCYDMPGIPKEDVKITIDDGVLSIRAEHKEEKEEEGGEDDDEYWASSSYGYYDASLVLPDDAKADEVKAELKDGVLTVTIPRSEKAKRDVKQVTVH